MDHPVASTAHIGDHIDKAKKVNDNYIGHSPISAPTGFSFF
jgi:hypothetical protein